MTVLDTVVKAIQEQGERKGCSLPTLKKALGIDATDGSKKRHLLNALKKGVDDGTLVQTKGFYKVSAAGKKKAPEPKKAAAPKKKATAPKKKVAAKKTTETKKKSPKKTATKSPKKKAATKSPKKPAAKKKTTPKKAAKK